MHVHKWYMQHVMQILAYKINKIFSFLTGNKCNTEREDSIFQYARHHEQNEEDHVTIFEDTSAFCLCLCYRLLLLQHPFPCLL